MIKRDNLVFRTLVSIARHRPGMDEERCEALMDLIAVAEETRSTLRQALHSLELTEVQFAILMVLLALDPEPVFPASLADHSGVSRASITESVDQLHALGFSARQRSSADRRNWLITLTPEGRRIADKAAVMVLTTLTGLGRPLEPPAPRALQILCDKLRSGHPRQSVHSLQHD
jgi:DNA-binding MarR family transcriptional regulator